MHNRPKATDEFVASNRGVTIDVDLSTEVRDYLVGRGVAEDVIESHVISGMVHGNPAVGFPYRSQIGTAIKWRTVRQKSFMQTGACRDFFLMETHVEGNRLLICEGELDALAWKSVDLPADITVLSIPNGAPSKESRGDLNDLKYRYLVEARDIIEAAPAVYLNFDADAPGRLMEKEFLRRVTNPNCMVIGLGDFKDAAECLKEEGTTSLRNHFEVASRPPLRGVHRASEYMDEILHRYEHGDEDAPSTGLASVDYLTSFPLGMVTVLTGYPGSGKSNFIDQIVVNMGLHHGWRSLMVNMEKQPKRHIPELIQKLRGEAWRDLSREQITASVEWIDDHIFFMDQSDKKMPDQIEGILAEAAKLVMIEGIRFISIDPYNYLSKDGQDKSETEYVAYLMKSLTTFAKQYDCHLVLIAHPMKPERSKGASDQWPPKGYDISGSANFFNITDLGLTMHRTENDENILINWKARFSDIGRQGRITMGFNPVLGIWYDLPDYRVQQKFDIDFTFPTVEEPSPTQILSGTSDEK